MARTKIVSVNVTLLNDYTTKYEISELSFQETTHQINKFWTFIDWMLVLLAGLFFFFYIFTLT